MIDNCFDEVCGEYLDDIEHDLALAIASDESLTDDPLNAAYVDVLTRYGVPLPRDAKWVDDSYARGGLRLLYTPHVVDARGGDL